MLHCDGLSEICRHISDNASTRSNQLDRSASDRCEGSVDPAILLDRSRSITLDARDEQDNQDTLAPALHWQSAPGGLLAPLSPVLDQYRSLPGGTASDRCDSSANELPDARGLLLADASDLGQGSRVSGEDTFDGAKVTQ